MEHVLHLINDEKAVARTFVKWTCLAVLAGLMGGAVISVFLKLLDFSIEQNGQLPELWRMAALPLGLIASSLLLSLTNEDKLGHFHVRVVTLQMICSVITMACGGSTGKEAPATHGGAGYAALIASTLHLKKEDERILYCCGVSAGFAAVFGTPLSAGVFALEMLYFGSLRYDVMYPVFISAVVSRTLAQALGIHHAAFSLAGHVPALTWESLAWALGAGLFFGLVSVCFKEMMALCRKLFQSMGNRRILKALVGAALLILLARWVGPFYLGLSEELTGAALRGEALPSLFAWFWKIAATAISFACGGYGGIVSPAFCIGAASGSAFARIFALDAVTFASWGFLGMLAGAVNSPLCAIVLAVEYFGGSTLPFAVLIALASYMVASHRKDFFSGSEQSQA